MSAFLLGCLTLPNASARAQSLGEGDMKKIAGTYEENEMRFKRDFAGKSFSAVLPFRNATENIFFKGQYDVGFGKGNFLADVDCTVSSVADIDRISDWNKGDMISVTGRISDVTMGVIQLKPCQMTK